MSNVYDKAISLLKIRPHASGEIIRKLTLRGFNTDEAREVTEQLKEQGLIDDALFAQTFLENLIRFKTFGFYGLKMKLMQRGIPGHDAEVLLKENLSLDLEKQIAQRVVERNKNLDKIKLAQKLSRKGFRSEVIRAMIEKPPENF